MLAAIDIYVLLLSRLGKIPTINISQVRKTISIKLNFSQLALEERNISDEAELPPCNQALSQYTHWGRAMGEF